MKSNDGKNVYWTDDKNAEIPIKYNPGSRNDIPAFCIHEFIEEKNLRKPDFNVFVCN